MTDSRLSGARDEARLREVCEHFLLATQWAGRLGDPLPVGHRAPAAKRYVTEIRHLRRVCQEVLDAV